MEETSPDGVVRATLWRVLLNDCPDSLGAEDLETGEDARLHGSILGGFEGAVLPPGILGRGR